MIGKKADTDTEKKQPIDDSMRDLFVDDQPQKEQRDRAGNRETNWHHDPNLGQIRDVVHHRQPATGHVRRNQHESLHGLEATIRQDQVQMKQQRRERPDHKTKNNGAITSLGCRQQAGRSPQGHGVIQRHQDQPLGVPRTKKNDRQGTGQPEHRGEDPNQARGLEKLGLSLGPDPNRSLDAVANKGNGMVGIGVLSEVPEQRDAAIMGNGVAIDGSQAENLVADHQAFRRQLLALGIHLYDLPSGRMKHEAKTGTAEI